MAKKVLIVKNITHEKPGLISQSLIRHGLKFDIIDLSIKCRFPKIDEYDLIIIMGGPDSANDNSKKIIEELEFIRLGLQKKIPIFGICLGLQLMVKVCGGEIYRNMEQEIGFRHENDKFYKIKLTKDGLKDKIFEGIKDDFIAFQLHGETVRLTQDVKLLGIGEFCKNQVIKIGDFSYGFQFHFELTRNLLIEWIEKAPELKQANITQILRDFNQINNNFINRGNLIFKNYLKLINLI